METKRLERTLIIATLVLLIAYLAVNWGRIFSEDSAFLLTTIGMFMWLILIALLMVHVLIEEVKKDVGYTIEDNIIEVKLLKDLTEQQIEEMKVLHSSIETILERSAPKKAAAKKKKR